MTIEVRVELATEEHAYQLAQALKRISFSTIYELTEAHLSKLAREARTYQMVAGVEAIRRGLKEAGYDPR